MPSFGAAPASGGSTFTSCFANSTDQIYGASPSASRTGSGLLDGPLRQLLSASAHLDADLAAAQKTAQDFNRRHSSIQRGLVTCLSRSQSMQQEESIERDLAQVLVPPWVAVSGCSTVYFCLCEDFVLRFALRLIIRCVCSLPGMHAACRAPPAVHIQMLLAKRYAAKC